ncbi:unnamed protein product, partial [marine sediment metagenome]
MARATVYTKSKAQRQKKVKQGDCQAGRPLFVKLYPGLSAAALKFNLDKELALWYELRAINNNGSSRLLLNDALAALVSSFGYSQATAYRLLKAGKGKFWDIRGSKLSGGFGGRSVVKIEGLYQVAAWFNTSV